MMLDKGAHYLGDHFRHPFRIRVVGNCHHELEVLHLGRPDLSGTLFAYQLDNFRAKMLPPYFAVSPFSEHLYDSHYLSLGNSVSRCARAASSAAIENAAGIPRPANHSTNWSR